jgi:hypothetical protein
MRSRNSHLNLPDDVLNEFDSRRGSRDASWGVADRLVSHLHAHPEICEQLLLASYNKRFSPSTFIEERGDGIYWVGWVPHFGKIKHIRAFNSFAQAATDYVLFSWGLPRLSKEQADWQKVDKYERLPLTAKPGA